MHSGPSTPPVLGMSPHVHAVTADDIALLEHLSAEHLHPPATVAPKFLRREAPFDLLLLAAAVSSGPHVTRHHFHHKFFPTAEYHPGSYESYDLEGELPPSGPKYVSKQKPRTERLKEEQLRLRIAAELKSANGLPAAQRCLRPYELTNRSCSCCHEQVLDNEKCIARDSSTSNIEHFTMPEQRAAGQAVAVTRLLR